MMRLKSWYVVLASITAASLCVLTEAVQAHLDGSNAYYQQGNLAGAIAELREILRLRPNDPEVYFMLGNAFYRQGDLHGAASAYRVTLEHTLNHFEAHMSRGFTLYELAEFEEAVAEWFAAVQVDHNKPFARAGLAIGLYKLGHIERAKGQYAEALALDKRYGDTESLRLDMRWKANPLSVIERLMELLHR